VEVAPVGLFSIDNFDKAAIILIEQSFNMEEIMLKVLDKRTAILNNALDLLVENGFHNTPMSLISRQAGVSAGIIYHYFDSKEALILEIYREVKTKFANRLFAGEPQHLAGPEALRQVWLNAYHFYVSHPKETLFLEQFENSPYARMCVDEFEEKFKPMVEQLEARIKAGEIINLPLDVLYDLTFGVAKALAKQQIAGPIQVDDGLLRQVSNAVLRSLQPERA
jgi:AcrR family transcriptional regulator